MARVDGATAVPLLEERHFLFALSQNVFQQKPPSVFMNRFEGIYARSCDFQVVKNEVAANMSDIRRAFDLNSELKRRVDGAAADIDNN